MEFEIEHLEFCDRPEIKIAISLVFGGIESFSIEQKSILSSHEFIRYQKQIPIVRTNFLLGRYAAKKAIVKVNPNINLNEIQINNGVWGFPVIINKNINNVQVSISHTDTSAAAICFPEDYPMGIDIEAITTTNMMIIKEELSKDEISLQPKLGVSIEDFCLSLWTAKEALAKAIKTGFRIPFKFFEISTFTRCGDLDLIKFKHFGQFVSFSTTISETKISIVVPVELQLIAKNLILGIRINK